VRRHQLFAAAVSVALLVGGAAPALATPGKGKAKGHDKPAAAPKPPTDTLGTTMEDEG